MVASSESLMTYVPLASTYRIQISKNITTIQQTDTTKDADGNSDSIGFVGFEYGRALV